MSGEVLVWGASLAVVAAIVLVDRQEENGLENIRRVAGPDTPVSAIVTLADLRG